MDCILVVSLKELLIFLYDNYKILALKYGCFINETYGLIKRRSYIKGLTKEKQEY